MANVGAANQDIAAEAVPAEAAALAKLGSGELIVTNLKHDAEHAEHLLATCVTSHVRVFLKNGDPKDRYMKDYHGWYDIDQAVGILCGRRGKLAHRGGASYINLYTGILKDAIRQMMATEAVDVGVNFTLAWPFDESRLLTMRRVA